MGDERVWPLRSPRIPINESVPQETPSLEIPLATECGGVGWGLSLPSYFNTIQFFLSFSHLSLDLLAGSLLSFLSSSSLFTVSIDISIYLFRFFGSLPLPAPLSLPLSRLTEKH